MVWWIICWVFYIGKNIHFIHKYLCVTCDVKSMKKRLKIQRQLQYPESRTELSYFSLFSFALTQSKYLNPANQHPFPLTILFSFHFSIQNFYSIFIFPQDFSLSIKLFCCRRSRISSLICRSFRVNQSSILLLH